MRTGFSRDVTRRVAEDAALLVAALALSYLESLVPLGAVLPIPGAKPGLAHIAVNVAASRRGMKDAAVVSLLRVLIAALLFGSLPSLLYSLTGAVFALVVLAACRSLPKLPFSFVGVSVLTAAAHNLGQLVAVSLTMHEAALFSYLPVLLLCAAFFGTLTGILTNGILTRLEKLR